MADEYVFALDLEEPIEQEHVYKLQPGDIFTVTPYGLSTMTIEDAEEGASMGIHPIEYWADGSISFMKDLEEEA